MEAKAFARFCCALCRKRANIARSKFWNARHCACCGQPFAARPDQRFCSKTCGMNARWAEGPWRRQRLTAARFDAAVGHQVGIEAHSAV